MRNDRRDDERKPVIDPTCQIFFFRKADAMPRHDGNTREVILNFTRSARRDSSPL